MPHALDFSYSARYTLGMAKIPYILVRWVDSQAGPGWRSRAEAEKWATIPGGEHLSIGFRLPIGPKDDVVLATSIQLAHGGNVGELLQIPSVAVLKITKLGSVDSP